MSRPLIGISATCTPIGENPEPRHHLRWEYVACVERAGGAAVIIPIQEDPETALSVCDGFLVPGGDDFDPALWGEEVHPAARLENRERYATERRLWEAMPPGMPFLGICYGCQMLNVTRGGTLHQHVPDIVGHSRHSGGTLERFSLDGESRLGSVMGTCPSGKSYHHQAINRLGEGLRIVGHSEDGLIEAIEDVSDRWIVGVQWHPERTMDAPETQSLFREFVARAAEYKEKRTR